MTLYTTLEPCTMCFGAVMQSKIGRIVFALEDPEGETLLFPRRGNRTGKRPGYQRPDVEPYIRRDDSKDLFQKYANANSSLPPEQQWRLDWPKRLAAQTRPAQTKDALVSFQIVIAGQTTGDRFTAATANTARRGPGTPVCTLCETGTMELATLDQAARG